MRRDFSDCVMFDDAKDGSIIFDEMRWFPIYEFPGYYINDCGDVLSFYRRTYPIVLAQWPNQHGHRYVHLRRRDGSSQKVLVHRLIAQSYIPNPENLPIVRHLDDDPTNNCADNLGWGTQTDNVQDCIRNGHIFRKPVRCVETGDIFESCTQAADHFNVTRSCVTMSCQGKNKTLRGYHLEYC